MPPLWSQYEAAARKVLVDLREVLGIATVEGKQSLAGASGTDWEIDAKAWLESGVGFLVVEVRRLTVARVKQEALAAVAYRVQDLGGAGGIVVSPLPLQKGAIKVAAAEGISHVMLAADSTAETYLAEFLGRRFFGVSAHDSITVTDSCDAIVVRPSGNGT